MKAINSDTKVIKSKSKNIHYTHYNIPILMKYLTTAFSLHANCNAYHMKIYNYTR